ncbi:hypothetical protein [Streptomonospora wellingtoniae]|uniref:Uncharacterized protein n=1 Tax=Streptomonospora wellingtoniae TaxID=3075544 RepID=A0ABU2KNC1_9ACTN|nr:hypothetical protein [Streptomonospora sp. DSM 45055]MDT0300738.1 hypothetical protein [Streptomonospora sp. DSM 45055]
MDNPLKRKNEAAADPGAERGRREPGSSGTAATGAGTGSDAGPEGDRGQARAAGDSAARSGGDTRTGAPAGAQPSSAKGEGGGSASAGHPPKSPATAFVGVRAGSAARRRQGAAPSPTAETAGSGGDPGRPPAAPAEGATPAAPKPAEPGASGAPAPAGSAASDAVPSQSARPSAGGRPSRDGSGTGERGAELFSAEEADRLQQRWRDAQSDFVDDPRTAVGAADELVGEVLRTLQERLSAHKRVLEGRWAEGAEPDTEDLRTTMRSYRAFFRQVLRAED